MDPLDRLCGRIARHRTGERAAARLLPALALGGLAGATALAVVRLAVPGVAWAAPAVVAAALLLPALVLPAALRRRDPAWLIAGLADRHLGAGGLAMALAAQPAASRDPAWLARLPAAIPDLPRPRLPGLAAACGALALLALAWCLPQTELPPGTPPVIGSTLRGAEQRLDTLRDEGLAPPDELRALEERLKNVREATGEQGLNQQTWAALDALDQDLEGVRARAADRLADALAKAEALGALAADAGAEAASRAAADLAAALADLQRDAPGLAAKLPPGADGAALLRLAQQAAAGGELTDAQREALRRFGLDPAQAGKPRPGDPQAARELADRLAADLAKRCQNGGACDKAGDGASGRPGKPGDPPSHPDLSWGQAERIPEGYRDRLAPGAPNHPQAGAVVGTQARAPRADEVGGEAPGTAAVVDQAAAAADARAAAVPPRHRAAVARYFDAAAAPRPPSPP